MRNEENVFLSWFEVVQIRRRLAIEAPDGGNQWSAPMPLARAVRDALALARRDAVSIVAINPRPGMAQLRGRQIACLAQRDDYPYRVCQEETEKAFTGRS